MRVAFSTPERADRVVQEKAGSLTSDAGRFVRSLGLVGWSDDPLPFSVLE